MLELLDVMSTVSLFVLFSITFLLGAVYAFDIFINVARSVLDQERGLPYYFSRKGPKN